VALSGFLVYQTSPTGNERFCWCQTYLFIQNRTGADLGLCVVLILETTLDPEVGIRLCVFSFLAGFLVRPASECK